MPLTIYKRGKIWHYRGSVAKRQLRGTTGTALKDEAQRFIVELERRHWKGHHDGPESVLTFAQAAMSYLQEKGQDRHFKRVVDYWKDSLVRDINTGAVRSGAIAEFPKASGATRNRHFIVPTQAIINHAASSGLCHRLYVERFETIKREKEPATWEWVQAFMANASPHLGALCCFMFLTGARVSEALAVRWCDVDLAAARVLIRQTKVGAERRPHLPPELVAAIANIPGVREPDKTVFQYSSKETAKFPWFSAIMRAKIKRLTFHACRHGFATALLHNKVDPITVARLGGWKSAQHVFLTYGHAMSDDTLANRIASTPEAQEAFAADKIVVKSKA